MWSTFSFLSNACSLAWISSIRKMHLISSSPHHGLLHTVSIPLVLLCLRPAGGTAVPSGKTATMACLAAGGFRLKISTVDFPRRWWEPGKMVRLFFQKKGAINQIQLLLSSMSVDVSSLLMFASMWGGKEDVTATFWMNERFWHVWTTYLFDLLSWIGAWNSSSPDVPAGDLHTTRRLFILHLCFYSMFPNTGFRVRVEVLVPYNRKPCYL